MSGGEEQEHRPIGQRARASPGFEPEAFLYGDLEQFAAATGAFVEEALADGQPVMAALPPDRLEALRHRLGDLAPRVRFVDMAVRPGPAALLGPGLGGAPAPVSLRARRRAG